MRERTGSATGLSFGAARILGVLALLTVLAVSPLSASAQERAPERYVFYLEASANKNLNELCVGDVAYIDVKAQRFIANKRATDTEMNTSPPVQIYGVMIEGAVGNPEVGGLFFTRAVTSARGTPPGSARFKFTATKAGSTGIVFTGKKIASNWVEKFVEGDRPYLSTEVEVTVKNCEYKVYATSQWHGFGLDYSSIVSDIGLVSTGGGLYSGTGTYTFVITDNPPRDPCGPHTRTYETEVALSGGLEGDQLEVGIDYAHPVGEWRIYDTFDCGPSARETLTQFPEALTFTIPASGGSFSYTQTLKDITNLPVYEIPNGGARVTVVPVAPQ